MDKKEEKVAKGKKKKKENEKKVGLSNREREIYFLTIAELEHKIQWRKHMSAIIEEDLRLYNEKLLLQQKDKEEAINLLEESIEEQRALTEKIQRSLPDAESAKNQSEERQARELADKLLQINQERHSNDAELEDLRKKLGSLEAYCPNKIDEKIKDIEKQLESEDAEDIFLNEEEQDVRRKKTFRREMEDILENEAESFQVEITRKLDKNFERITEETRWWADAVNGLRIETERLEAINDTKSTNLRTVKRNLKERKEASLRESQKLQEGEAILKGLIQSNKQLESEKKDDAECQKHVKFLESTAKKLKQNLDTQEDYLTECLELMKVNETEIKDLEEKLSTEISFGNQLKGYIEKAHQLIAEEVKHSLILTYDGPPKKTNTVEEMRRLFEEATRFIYDRKHKSMI